MAYKENKNSSHPQIPTEHKVRTMRPLRELILKIDIITKNKNIEVAALLDSGANGVFIDTEWAKTQRIPLKPLELVVPVYNVDGTINSAGGIAYTADLIIDFQGHREKITADVTNLGRNQMILGYTWLREHNPLIDWTKGTVKLNQCPTSCQALNAVYHSRLDETEIDHSYRVQGLGT